MAFCKGALNIIFFFSSGTEWAKSRVQQETHQINLVFLEVVVSPPFVFLTMAKSSLRSDFHVVAQNCWVKKGGAFTSEISAEMLVNLCIPWVIIGHSERRLILNESNEFVADKEAYALSQGLKVIACIGETPEQRESGSTMDVVAAQTKAIADKVKNWDDVVLAYEPVWAIGTGKVATPSQAQERLYKLDGRKFVVGNVGPIGCIPYKRSINRMGSDECVKLLNELAIQYKGRLKDLLAELNDNLPGATFALANVYDLVIDNIGVCVCECVHNFYFISGYGCNV